MICITLQIDRKTRSCALTVQERGQPSVKEYELLPVGERKGNDVTDFLSECRQKENSNNERRKMIYTAPRMRVLAEVIYFLIWCIFIFVRSCTHILWLGSGLRTVG
jgi:hypothetical protein